MKIAVFTNTFTPHVGGVAKSVASLVDRMREHGHRVLVVAPDFSDQPEQEQDVLRVPSIKNFNGSDFSFRLPSGNLIGETIKRFSPDVIHSHHPFLLGDAGLRLAHQWGVPLVFTHHTRYEDYVHYLVEDSEWIERLAVELATEYANLCDRIIAPSNSIEDLITERGVKSTVNVIPTGIDTDAFSAGNGVNARKQYGIDNDAFVIGHVGRLAPEKNLDFLFQAVLPFLKANPDSVFMVVGSGESRDSLARMADSKGLRDRVHFIGKLTRQSLVDAYHAFDVFAFSSHTETQGMVLAEAMAAGRPVVALEAPGVREILRHRENGIRLSPDATPEQFQEALGELRDLMADKAESVRASLRETAHAFSEKVCIGKMEETYETVVREKRRDKDMPTWTRFISRMEAEWDLALGRARAFGAAIRREEDLPSGE